jgi:NAD(P)-dependent dehydrogenase (short-subunit alcohol dehydrogenase family)
MKKTVLITGASSGFGRETVKLFIEKGWNVIATIHLLSFRQRKLLQMPHPDLKMPHPDLTLVHRKQTLHHPYLFMVHRKQTIDHTF